MGLVILDMTFRVERKFRIRMPKTWPQRLGISWDKGGSDATLGQFHELVLELCREQHVLPCADSWNAIARIVEDATGMEVEKITVDTKLIEDIAPYG